MDTPTTNAATLTDLADALPAMMFRRSAYPFLQIPAPVVLSRIAAIVSRRLKNTNLSPADAMKNRLAVHAFNVYRRMGDLELYKSAMRNELDGEDKWRAASLASSLIVGYFSAAKSVLDAAAVMLNDAYSLGLSAREQDFVRGRFWNVLSATVPTVVARYQEHRTFVSEVQAWRDAAVHRTTPFLLVNTTPEFKGDRPAKPGEAWVRMAPKPDAGWESLFPRPGEDWIDPLEIPTRWHHNFEQLCSALEIDFDSAPLP